MKRVLANGCFDPLHYGHVLHLRAARAMGDYLIVALTMDDAVSREKGDGRPLYTWEQRAGLLSELRCVNAIVGSDNACSIITMLAPDIFVKGIDYTMTGIEKEVREACELVGAEIRYTDTPKLSASEYIGRMRALAA